MSKKKKIEPASEMQTDDRLIHLAMAHARLAHRVSELERERKSSLFGKIKHRFKGNG